MPAVAPSGRQVARRGGGSNSVVESQPSKLLVAGSIPVSRSILRSRDRDELRMASHLPGELVVEVKWSVSGSRLVGRSGESEIGAPRRPM